MSPIRKNDLQKMGKIIEEKVKKQLPELVKDKLIPLECPHCHAEISVKPGVSVCPACGGEIDLTIRSK